MPPRKEGHDKVPDASLMLLRPSARSVFVALTHQIEWRVGLSEEPIRMAQAVDESFFILSSRHAGYGRHDAPVRPKPGLLLLL